MPKWIYGFVDSIQDKFNYGNYGKLWKIFHYGNKNHLFNYLLSLTILIDYIISAFIKIEINDNKNVAYKLLIYIMYEL